MLETSTTKVFSKGHVVIPANVSKAAGLRKGERALSIAMGDVVLKKIVDRSFEESMKPVWEKVRELGISEQEIDAIVEEARS